MKREQVSRPVYAVRDDVLTAHLQGEAVVLSMDSKTYFQLNETAAAVWSALETGATRTELVERLCAEFEVEPEEAGRELDALLKELVDRELIDRRQPEAAP